MNIILVFLFINGILGDSMIDGIEDRSKIILKKRIRAKEYDRAREDNWPDNLPMEINLKRNIEIIEEEVKTLLSKLNIDKDSIRRYVLCEKNLYRDLKPLDEITVDNLVSMIFNGLIDLTNEIEEQLSLNNQCLCSFIDVLDNCNGLNVAKLYKALKETQLQLCKIPYCIIYLKYSLVEPYRSRVHLLGALIELQSGMLCNKAKELLEEILSTTELLNNTIMDLILN
ncbi:hypothetical protein NEOKW01_1503 [Nematocida sp. AWRm80]|nr:hypothetical protein NEOKW01_1503 [Nematocida sp. AWRm80]